jgi:protein involved in polysaccharide export with SLBB domain
MKFPYRNLWPQALRALPLLVFAQVSIAQVSAADLGTLSSEEKQAALQKLTPKKLDQPKNDFQVFVQESTGRNLELFGHDLFSAPGRYAPVLSTPVPQSYVLGPGDEILLQTFGVADMASRLVIDRDGKVSIPKVGPLVLAGVPFSEAESTLTNHISKVYTNFTLSLSMGRVRTIEVFVVGQANQPGKHAISGLSTLINALFETGGANQNGSLRRVQLRRGGKTIAEVDLYQFLHKGDTASDVRLQSGDIIVIPSAGDLVALTGSVNRSAIFEIKPGESVEEVLAISGGVPFLANPQKVQLERLSAQRDVPRYVETFALDAGGLKRRLQGGDVLTLLQISPQFDNVVTLQGHVKDTLRHPFKSGMRISDLVADPKILITRDYWRQVNANGNASLDLPVVNFDYATVRRMDPKTLKTQLITFNLSKALASDPRNNLELQSGDIVTVYNTVDVDVPLGKKSHFVTIEGEVNAPGMYEIKPGESLSQLLYRVGGFTENAYVYGAVFSRESTRKQQQENLDIAIRRAEADLSAKVSYLTQNQSKDSASSGTNSQTAIALQRQQLDRLKGMRPSGRMALDLDFDSRTLPSIDLQGGDKIKVPFKPAYVSVMGAVMTEASIAYRPNETISYYIAKAGITRAADVDGLLIVRANGNVESEINGGFASFLTGGIGRKAVYPGDTLYVPDKVDLRTDYTRFIEGAKDWTSIFYQFGLGAAAIKTLK